MGGPHQIIRAANLLGEGILWDFRRQPLWWTDIHACRLYCYDWTSGALRVLPTPGRIGSFGLVADSDPFITAFADGIALYHPEQQSVDWLTKQEVMPPGVRFNDGRVDRRGRFWSGTMVENDGSGRSAGLYSVRGGGETRSHIENLQIANGLCHSPDGRHLYFVDTPTRRIHVYDLIEPEGLLGPPRLFVETPSGAFPDGATVDADGCVWSAHWGAGVVVRYTPAGRIDRTLVVPTQQPTCVCFAGPALDVLCVTSAREGLSDATLLAEPHAGDVFLYRPGVTGLPECEYRP